MNPLVALVLLTGCIAQVQAVISPQPTATGGTATCREIVENCDRNCTDPFCVRNCTGQGTPEAQAQHTAVVDCAQRNACTDETCIQANCASEAATCEGPPPPTP